MGRYLSEEGGSRELLPEGKYLAICTHIVDLGEQFSEQYNKFASKLQIIWELPEETYEDKDGVTRPRRFFKKYTASLNEKATLRKDLTAWRGRAFTSEELARFDIKSVLGVPCEIQIIHAKGDNGRTYENMASISCLRKGSTFPEPTEKVCFFFDDPETYPVLKTLDEWLLELIKQSSNYTQVFGDTGDSNEDLASLSDEDVPF